MLRSTTAVSSSSSSQSDYETADWMGKPWRYGPGMPPHATDGADIGNGLRLECLDAWPHLEASNDHHHR